MANFRICKKYQFSEGLRSSSYTLCIDVKVRSRGVRIRDWRKGNISGLENRFKISMDRIFVEKKKFDEMLVNLSLCRINFHGFCFLFFLPAVRRIR